MNYIYLKQSPDPVKFGDITIHGFYCDITRGGSHVFKFNSDIPRRYTSLNGIVALTPLLIMDAPEHKMNKSFYYGEEQLWKERFNEIISLPMIPFHSNEEVYTWLKMKGFTPEPESLIEFDGEVKIELEPLPTNFKIRCEHCLDAGFFGNIPCKWCNYGGEFKGIPKDENHPVQLVRKKVAFIKQPVNERTYTKGELISFLVRERQRAVDIAYEFMNTHKQGYTYKKIAGNELAFVEQNLAEECRYIGNTISGLNALSITLGKTIESVITEEINNTSK